MKWEGGRKRGVVEDRRMSGGAPARANRLRAWMKTGGAATNVDERTFDRVNKAYPGAGNMSVVDKAVRADRARSANSDQPMRGRKP